MRRPRAAAASLLLALACGTRTEPSQPTASTLPPGAVARVAGELVSGSSVERIAAAQGLALKEALARAISDAVLAASGRERLEPGASSSIERAALARALLERLGAEAAAAGPPTEAEITDLLRERWTELDRPAAARTTHAVVINQDPKREADAKALAEALRAELAAATSAEDFMRRAKAVPGQGFDVKSEQLPAITADGRAFERHDKGYAEVPMSFDRDFARAALMLQRAGELSPVVKTRFGFHVIRLEERIAASALPKTDLLSKLAPEVQTRRAASARRALLEKLRGANAVQIERAVDELTARVRTQP
jgi:hypothetical protein